MANTNNRNEFNLSLIQQQEHKRAIVERMRGKLAGRSQGTLPEAGRKRATSRGASSARGWRIVIAAVLVASATAWFPRKATSPVPAKPKSAIALASPSEKFGINDQALFWTYALYDFERLKASYGVPKNAIVDAGMAAGKLRALRPKVDSRTRFIIDGYMTNDRRKS